MKIWFFSVYDAPRGHSSRTFDYSLELVKLGHEVTFFASSFNHFSQKNNLDARETHRIENVEGVRVVWLKTFPYKDNGLGRLINAFSFIYRAILVEKTCFNNPDVVFGPSVPLFLGVAASWIAGHRKARFVFEVRDIWPQALIDLGLISKNGLAKHFLRFMERFLYRRSDSIIAVLPFAYRHIYKSCKLTDGKVHWIPNGVRLARYEGIGEYDGGTSNCLRAMYVGGFSSTHDIKTILGAASLLCEEKQNIHFTIIGGGKSKEKNEEFIQKNQLANVTFLGIVPKSEIASAQTNADVLIASVKDTPVYQFGINSNKIFDYLASGRPILFAGNSPNDPVKEADAGISIPPENPKAMAEALKTFLHMKPSERKKLGTNGLNAAKSKYDTRELALKLEKILASLF